MRASSTSSSLVACSVMWAPCTRSVTSRTCFAQVPFRAIGAPSPCQLIKTNFAMPVSLLSTRRNAYCILPEFSSAASSLMPSSPVSWTFSTLL
uniref:Putative secreted protein n=1 Tax=Anopheles triannulatus TaxID=58253 RepID=A0A2M4B3L9_9DIPT